MEIIITKGPNRNVLTCIREDGTSTSESLGPDFPNHDLAHYIVEKKFKMDGGFYGKIRSGYSIQQLSDKEVIRTLGPESWVAEIMSRNLQALGSGACSVNEYIELVQWEGANMKTLEIPVMETKAIEEMKKSFDQLCQDWDHLQENDQLILHFP